MRNLLALVGLVVVGFGGLGWYLGWYKFAVSPGLDGQQHIQMDVDTKKIGADARRIEDTVSSAVQNFQAKAADPKADAVGPPLPAELQPKGATTPATGPVSFTLPGSPRDNRP